MKVEVVETTLVAPSEATPQHALWLSNLDLAVPKTHTPLVYYYPAPSPPPADAGAEAEAEAEGFFAPERLREALARALVPFYPLAGRLAAGPGGRLEIDCNGEGALFVVARADFTGDEMFTDFEPSPEARRLLVPFAASGEPPCVLAMVQVFSNSPLINHPTPIMVNFLHLFTPPPWVNFSSYYSGKKKGVVVFFFFVFLFLCVARRWKSTNEYKPFGQPHKYRPTVMWGYVVVGPT